MWWVSLGGRLAGYEAGQPEQGGSRGTRIMGGGNGLDR